MQPHVILLALDSVGIDPAGHDRSESVYGQSRFLFPAGRRGDLLPLPDAPVPGALVETDVIGTNERGAIECAITYTSIFSGQSAVDRHGLMRGLGLNEQLLKEMVAGDNLFRHFQSPCLVNAIFPYHFTFLGSSFVQDLLPAQDRLTVESRYRMCGQPLCLKGRDKRGLPELFTLAEINQNIFVHAARTAGMKLYTWEDVRRRQALTSSMSHQLEADFEFFGQEPLPVHTAQKAAAILVSLAAEHDFTFYKYQIPDLVSHTGRIELAREVFATIEAFVEAVLQAIDPSESVVVITSDHGHLEQLASSHAHPKSKVPTWYFGPDPERTAERLRRPEEIFRLLAPMGQAGRFSVLHA
jgi:hypothetical protein